MREHNTSVDAATSEVFSQVNLLRSRRARDSTQRFVIEGIRQFIQACETRFEFDAVIHSPILLQHGLARKLIRELRRAGVRLVTVVPERFRDLRLPMSGKGNSLNVAVAAGVMMYELRRRREVRS